MKKLLVLLALLGLAATPLFAQGPVTGPYLIDHYSNNVGTGATYLFNMPANKIDSLAATTFSFREPQILTTTTTIPGSSLTIISVPANCTINYVQLISPGSPGFQVTVAFAGTGCTIGTFTFFFIGGPATTAGTFTLPPPNTDVTLTITSFTAPDQQVRLINFGTNGTPLTSPTGDVCANIYVFDANQEMAACCSCRITPNGLKTLNVFTNLTTNPVTGIIPVNGDIKIVSTAASGPTACSPLGFNGGLTDSLVGFGTHVNTTSAGAFIDETQIPAAALSSQEQNFLPQACQFARFLGSGKGVCACNVDDHLD